MAKSIEQSFKDGLQRDSKKVAHVKTDDTTVRSIKRHLKSRQKMRDAAINYRLLKGV